MRYQWEGRAASAGKAEGTGLSMISEGDIRRRSDEAARSLSIVIPVYRSAGTLNELYSKLIESLEPIGLPFEIVLVEDCGGDASWEVIKNLASRDARVRGVKLRRNYGQHNALLCGVRAALNEVIVTLDDDLQNPPDQIPRLLAELSNGCDVVYGVPETEQHGVLRDIASQVTKFALQSAMGAKNTRNVAAFRAFRTSLREGFEGYRSPSVSIDVLLSWATDAFSSVKVRHEPRAVGVSNYTWGKLIAYAFNLVTGFSTVPLRLVSAIGFVFTLFGLGILMWVFGRYLTYGSVVPGFVFLATIITIYAGVQLFALGIFGEYLARIYARTMDKPTYVVRETTSAVAREPQDNLVQEQAQSVVLDDVRAASRRGHG
jgi:glycosyltransferase involved in cell wall biosynthesis